MDCEIIKPQENQLSESEIEKVYLLATNYYSKGVMGECRYAKNAWLTCKLRLQRKSA